MTVNIYLSNIAGYYGARGFMVGGTVIPDIKDLQFLKEDKNAKTQKQAGIIMYEIAAQSARSNILQNALMEQLHIIKRCNSFKSTSNGRVFYTKKERRTHELRF